MDLRAPLRRLRAEAGRLTGRQAAELEQLDGTRAAILMYHRVVPASRAEREAVEPGMFVTPRTFARHLDWLQAELRVLPLHEIVDRFAHGRPLPHRACAITFDDGWRDNLEHAAPELSRRALPATVFVVAGRIGTPGAFWPDEISGRLAALRAAERRALARALGLAPGRDPRDAVLRHLKSLDEASRPETLEWLRARTPALPRATERDLLDWPELDRLAGQGVSVESHGMSHAILTGLPEDDAERELVEALELLRARGHAPHALLAWPSGACASWLLRLARRVGYRGAVATDLGLADRRGEVLRLPRIGLHEAISRSRAEFRRLVPGPG